MMTIPTIWIGNINSPGFKIVQWIEYVNVTVNGHNKTTMVFAQAYLLRVTENGDAIVELVNGHIKTLHRGQWNEA